MTTISFFVPGTPQAQPRQKQRIVYPKGGGKPFASNYDPGTAEVWKREVRLAAIDHIPAAGALTGPLCLELTFYFPRPESHFGTGRNEGKLKENAPKWHDQRPDRDNLDKAIMDSLKTVGMLRDDCKVCDGYIKKLWGLPGKTGCQIVITTLDNTAVGGDAARMVFAASPEPRNAEQMLPLITT